jgi:cytochrome c peroxidase
MGAFRTAPLRNVAVTPPYLHDGSAPTLKAVIDLYDRGGISNPHLDPLVRPLQLSRREKADLVAYLKALTGDQVVVAVPPMPK